MVEKVDMSQREDSVAIEFAASSCQTKENMPPTHIASSSFLPVVLAPTYNNATTLADVLERIGRLGLPAIVVDDGATDQTAAILEQFSWLSVVRHPRNGSASGPTGKRRRASPLSIM